MSREGFFSDKNFQSVQFFKLGPPPPFIQQKILCLFDKLQRGFSRLLNALSSEDRGLKFF